MSLIQDSLRACAAGAAVCCVVYAALAAPGEMRLTIDNFTFKPDTITVPVGSSSMTLEIEGGGGGGGGDTGIVKGNGGSSGGRCVSTYAITSGQWGHTLTLTCGVSLASTGTNNGVSDSSRDSADDVVSTQFEMPISQLLNK